MHLRTNVRATADDLDSLHEALHALSTPGAVADLSQATRDYADGKTTSGEQLRERYGLEPR